MSVFNVPTQTYPVGVTAIPQTVTKPAGATDVLVQMAVHTTTDWVTGAAGRTLSVRIQKSFDNGANWGSDILGSATSPNMGRDHVSLPTVATMGIGVDPANTQYRATVTAAGGSVSTGWDITVQ